MELILKLVIEIYNKKIIIHFLTFQMFFLRNQKINKREVIMELSKTKIFRHFHSSYHQHFQKLVNTKLTQFPQIQHSRTTHK